MTAHALDGEREKCLAAGMDDYITKPVKRERLAQILASWLPEASLDSPTDCENPSSGSASPSENSLKMASGGNPPLVDMEQLMLITGEDSEFQQELLETFSEDALKSIEVMKEVLDVQDWEHLYRLAHKLKGASSSAAVLRVPDLAAEVESQVKHYYGASSNHNALGNGAASVTQMDVDVCQLRYLVETMESTLKQLRSKVEQRFL